MKSKRSRVHPKFKTKYRVENWAESGRALVRRGDLTASVGRWRPSAINRIAEVGRREWRRESAYHQQARVENAMFRYNRIVRPRLSAVNEDARKVEASAARNVLNRMLGLGRARLVRVVAVGEA